MYRLALAFAFGAFAIAQENVPQLTWTLDQGESLKAGNGALKLSTTLPEPWHLYSATTPKGTGIPFQITFPDQPAVTSFEVFQAKPIRKFDANFQADSETFEKDIVFYIVPKVATPAPAELTVKLRYQICTDKVCVPQRKTLTIPYVAAAAGATFTPPQGFVSTIPVAAKAVEKSGTGDSQSLGAYLLTAFGLGLAALFTPCVFPMIPFVMSGFLNRDTGSKKEGVLQAGLFCLGIIVLFCLLGFVITAALGPFGVVQLSASPWVNGFIAILFGVFGLSLLGAFEIVLPSALTNAVDEKSRQGGSLGTLLMSLSFALTSFACVGPFVGTLLAGSIQDKGLKPVLGMATFATGLAAPFFLLALFPQYLKRMPKSGGWLVRVKMVMGFLVLAGMLKYVSNIDSVLQWGFLTRDRFLATWIVLFALAGLYLLGFLRLEGIAANENMGVGRLLTGAFFLIFAIHLIPGMSGGRLGELDAYIPPAAEGSIGTATTSNKWMKDQYKEAIAKAKAENKLVLINFTGYACTNCHWMRQNMFPKPEVQAAIENMVLLELFTDGTDKTNEDNQKLQESKFKTVALPFYALVDGDERVVATFAGLTKNTSEFVTFLQSKLS